MGTVAAERRQGKVMGRATRLNKLKGTCGRWGGRGRAQAPVRDDHGGPGQACHAGGKHPHPWYCTPRDDKRSVGGPVWGGGEGTATALARHARGCRTRPRRPAGPRSGTSQSRSLTSPWPTSSTPLSSTAWRVSVGTNCTPHTAAAGRPAPPTAARCAGRNASWSSTAWRRVRGVSVGPVPPRPRRCTRRPAEPATAPADG
jgi:hypothetical protein